MNSLNCEYVREVYPDVLNGAAITETVATVRAHLANCAECREEAALIDMVYEAAIVAPAGLNERVMVGLQEPVRRAPRMRYLALAATVAAAIIGGTILFDTRAEPGAPATEGLGFVTVEDVMVSGTASLKDLTVEELEQLLGEIES